MCKSELLTDRRQHLAKWLKVIQEKINDLECDDKKIKHIILDAHWFIVRQLQVQIKDIDFELEKIRIREYEKSRVEKHEEKERDHDEE